MPLIKILSGAYQRDSGEIWIEGKKAEISSPRDARDYNIETIYQTLALADNIDAASNYVTSKLGFGLDLNVMADPITTRINDDNVANISVDQVYESLFSHA